MHLVQQMPTASSAVMLLICLRHTCWPPDSQGLSCVIKPSIMPLKTNVKEQVAAVGMERAMTNQCAQINT